jgi:hypothetical protein
MIGDGCPRSVMASLAPPSGNRVGLLRGPTWPSDLPWKSHGVGVTLTTAITGEMAISTETTITRATVIADSSSFVLCGTAVVLLARRFGCSAATSLTEPYS